VNVLPWCERCSCHHPPGQHRLARDTRPPNWLAPGLVIGALDTLVFFAIAKALTALWAWRAGGDP
jgi:hypothetical protein